MLEKKALEEGSSKWFTWHLGNASGILFELKQEVEEPQSTNAFVTLLAVITACFLFSCFYVFDFEHIAFLMEVWQVS